MVPLIFTTVLRCSVFIVHVAAAELIHISTTALTIAVFSL